MVNWSNTYNVPESVSLCRGCFLLPGLSLLSYRLVFQKGLFDKTVDNNPMGLPELADFIRLKTAGHIDLSETIIIEHIQDIA